MTRTRTGPRPKQDLGYAAILIVLGQVTIMMAPTRAAQLSGVAIIVLVALDIVAGWLGFIRLKVRICGSGTYSSDDAIPVDIVSSRPLRASKNRLLLHHARRRRSSNAEAIIDTVDDGRAINHTVTLARGRYQTLPYIISQQSPLGLCTFSKMATSEIDLFVGPASESISIEHLPDHEIELAGVRPAQSGDPRRLVHWPSTARAQELMVKDRAPVQANETAPLLVVLDLGYDRDRTSELAAGRARSYAERALGLGHSVDVMVSTTTGRDRKSSKAQTSRVGASSVGASSVGTVSSVTRLSVSSGRDILKILAQANGAIAVPPTKTGRMVHVTQRGDQWSES